MNNRTILLAHNIRSLWNVGSLFRTCDCFGVQKLYLSGYTATPPRREISKTAIGAEEYVEWEHEKDPLNVIERLKSDGWMVVGLEQSDRSVDLADFDAPDKTCLVVGHEVTGIDQEILDRCDAIVEIPMKGKKESLNVAVAAGVALHTIASQ